MHLIPSLSVYKLAASFHQMSQLFSNDPLPVATHLENRNCYFLLMPEVSKELTNHYCLLLF